MIGKTIAELRPGDYAEIERHVEMDAIAEFIDAVGDFNPIHSDPAYAAATSFGEPIAPGVFTAGLISAVIGTQLPMTAEMRPAVKTPGAMGSPKLVAAAYAGSLWIGLKSPTASMNSAIA